MKNLLTLILICSFSLCFAQDEIEIYFDHYAILVKDLDSSATFYQEVMGLKEIEDQTQLEHIRWFSMGGKTELHVIESKDYKIPDEKGIHLALKVSNLDAFIKKMVKHKIEFRNWFGLVGRTNSRPDGVRQIYLQDPNGYWIEINGK